jgi:hypothetical protein
MLPSEHDIAFRFWLFLNKLFFRFMQKFSKAQEQKHAPSASFSLFTPHNRPHEVVPHSSSSINTATTEK